jgi:hypothetical protein
VTLRLCFRCQNWTRNCFRAVDSVPFYSVLCTPCLVKCPDSIAAHYAPFRVEVQA